MAPSTGVRARSIVLAALLLLLWALPHPVAAQSITEGRLLGYLVSPQGAPVKQAQVTLTSESTGSQRGFKSDYLGRFILQMVAPGTYSLLVEQPGYQPVRLTGVRVFPGRTAHVRITVTRRPPPITKVEEVPAVDRGEPSTGTSFGQYFNEAELRLAPWRSDLANLSRGSSIVSPPRDGRVGYAEQAGGLPQAESKIFADGLPGFWLRHPGLPGEPAGAPVYLRGLFEQAQIINNSFDGEWRGGPGTALSGYGRRGSNALVFQPYVTYSGKQALSSLDNPADSSATSVQAGAVVSGALVKNKAQFVAGLDYQSLEQPSAAPWAEDSASFDGAPVSLSRTIAKIANDSFSTSAAGFTEPTVRSWKGGSGGARLDWQVTRSATSSNSLMARFSLAKWKEEDPILGQDVLNDFGSLMEARDFSGGISFTSIWGNKANEFRFGHRTTSREWSGPSLPSTYFVGEAAGIGSAPALPGGFKAHAFDLSETFHLRAGEKHILKAGLQWTSTTWTQSYAYGRDGIFQFGDLDQFGDAVGTFFKAVGPSSEARFTAEDFGLFGQDAWTPSRGLVITGGVGWTRQKLPTKAADNPITPNGNFNQAFNRPNAFLPSQNHNIEGRLGLVWDFDEREEWIVRAGGSLTYAGLDLPTLAEAGTADGGLRIRRGIGTFSSWPVSPDSVTGAPFVGDRITFIDDNYKSPRAIKLDASVTHTLASAVAITVNGGYHHTDYLLRRTDINLPATALAQTSEGRPLYGTLVQQGGLLTPDVQSNRRFTPFDMVSEMASTGFSDYYEAGIEVARRSPHGISFAGGYTWSRTLDNWSVAPATGDPADQLNPFPEDGLRSQWIEGRSDYDIPHRARFSAMYRGSGRYPFGVGVRYRFRSGLPYTPGFQPGVDANGDGSGRNDPAYIDLNTPGMSNVVSANACLQGQSGLVERNSCREASNHALDLSASFGVPVGSAGNVEITVDAFNVVATETGLVDRALMLIDPSGNLTTDSQGNVVLPLLANPHFGKLMIRRGEGRVIRIGLRLGY